MILALGTLVIAAAVYAIRRGVDVRLALIVAGLLLGGLAGQPSAVVRKFFSTFVAEEFLIPICTAMGFAHVLRETGCDGHLVRLLVSPLRRARAILVPGAVLVGFLVNIPIISQTSAAATMGPVMIPVMLAAGVSPIAAGATLLLGASIGGELLNPGAPEFRTVTREATLIGHPLTGADCVRAVLPLLLLHLGVTTAAFWMVSPKAESEQESPPEAEAAESLGRIRYDKAAVPLVPLALLFVVAPPLELVRVPREWLVSPFEPALSFDGRLIGAAMVVGVAAAALTAGRAALGVIGPFFAGAGFAFTHIISIIVAAACFGEGVKLLGLDRVIAHLITVLPHLLVPIASLLSLALAALSGSGMAATQSLYGLFAGPSVGLGVAPEHVGAVVSLSAAAGRTMSPVAAVTVMCASLTGTRPLDLAPRVAGPLLLGVAALALAATLMAGSR